MTNVEALKSLYVALGGSADDVANVSTIVGVLNAIAAKYDGDDDAILNPDAIANITAVAGNLTPEPTLQNKTVTPTTAEQTIEAGEGYDGLGTVTVEAVTAAIDSDIVAGNIKKDVEILGVTGTYDYNAKFAMTTGQFTLANNIVAIELPDGLTAISNTMFSGATNLKTIEVPNSITVINATAFSGCTELSTIIINKAQDSITGAPWGAPSSTQVIWNG